jgi:hypothetical protein
MDELGPRTWRRTILLTRAWELERNCGSGAVPDKRGNQEVDTFCRTRRLLAVVRNSRLVNAGGVAAVC